MTAPSPPTRLIVGCMTGTSLDGLDTALLEVRGTGLSITARLLKTHSAPLGNLAAPLRDLAEQRPTTAAAIAQLSRDFALLHAAAIRDLLAGDRADLIAVHGQTVFHKPPLSWQLLNAPVLAHELNTPAVFDLRAADLAAGGQGAPITPLADWILFRRHGDPMAVINLGGFCNYSSWFTALSADEEFPQPWRDKLDIRGGDICACNQILDALARYRLGQPYDDEGRIAEAGVPDSPACEALRTLLQSQAESGRSLGTGDELAAWARKFDALPAPDLLRSACEAVAAVIVPRVSFGTKIVAAGGGVRNRTLLAALQMKTTVLLSDDLGIPASHREAACFAILGALCQDRIPITLPQVTGVRAPAPIAGCWAYA